MCASACSRSRSAMLRASSAAAPCSLACSRRRPASAERARASTRACASACRRRDRAASTAAAISASTTRTMTITRRVSMTSVYPRGAGGYRPGMTLPELDTLLGWRGRTVRDRDGEELGTLGDLYLDESDRPAYGGVRTGLFGRRESIVPLSGMTAAGDDLRVPYGADLIRDAPRIEGDEVLSPEDEERLGSHYEVQTEMVRSEEEVEVGTSEMRPAERVRLRKVLVTEDVQTTVPVRREEVRLETEPPPEGEIESVEDAGPPR